MAAVGADMRVEKLESFVESVEGAQVGLDLPTGPFTYANFHLGGWGVDIVVVGGLSGVVVVVIVVVVVVVVISMYRGKGNNEFHSSMGSPVTYNNYMNRFQRVLLL